MAITAADVGKLRELTGAGMMDAKRALEEQGGNVEAAIDALRKSGAAKAAKKAERATAEGRMFSYTHGNKLAVLVELLCETDFVARNEQFVAFGQDLALHIAAAAPQYVSQSDVPADVVEREQGPQVGVAVLRSEDERPDGTRGGAERGARDDRDEGVGAEG